MKRILSCVLAAFIILSMAGCSNDETPPTITLTSDVQLNVGDSFDPMEYISATDDTTAAESIKIEITDNQVDTNTSGQYAVTYQAADKAGNLSTATLNVSVLSQGELFARAILSEFKSKMKNPDSFSLNDVTMVKWDSGSSGEIYLLGVDYSAQNGFGGTNRDTYYFKLDSDGNFIEDTGKAYTDDWSLSNKLLMGIVVSKSETITLDVTTLQNFLDAES